MGYILSVEESNFELCKNFQFVSLHIVFEMMWWVMVERLCPTTQTDSRVFERLAAS
jgi:hypothetical protein